MPARKKKAAPKAPRPRRTRQAVVAPNDVTPQVVAPVDFRKSRDGNVAPGREGSTR